jgi:adenylate kinase family enzyme
MTGSDKLAALGARIAIIGPSASGKSTLAEALGAKIGAKPIHLDLLAHYPDTQWQARPKSELVTLHDAELGAEAWVIEGNYSICMPQRFARATGAIWLDFGRWGCLWRYLKRTMQPAAKRKGVLPGSVERLNWMMVDFIVRQQPPKHKKYAGLLEGVNGPVIRLKSMRELKALYKAWGL